MDWVSFGRNTGHFTAVGSDVRTKAYTRTAWIIRCATKLGLSDEDGAEWWRQLYADPSNKRTPSSFGGVEELHVPRNSFFKRQEDYVDNHVQEQGRQIKNYSKHDKAVLLHHIRNQNITYAAEWLQVSQSAVDDVESLDQGIPGEQPNSTQAKCGVTSGNMGTKQSKMHEELVKYLPAIKSEIDFLWKLAHWSFYCVGCMDADERCNDRSLHHLVTVAFCKLVQTTRFIEQGTSPFLEWFEKKPSGNKPSETE